MVNDIDYYKRKLVEGDYHSFLCSKFWKDKRKQILERDNLECQRCKGKYDGGYPIKKIKLTQAALVHHHIPAQDNIDLILDDDNLISLCWHCHEIVEGRTEGFSRFIKSKKTPITEERW